MVNIINHSIMNGIVSSKPILIIMNTYLDEELFMSPTAMRFPAGLKEIEEVPVHRPLCVKIQYRSFREAQAVINYGKSHRRYSNGKRINRRVGKKDIRPIRSYRCEVCGFWHLTSQPDYNE